MRTPKLPQWMLAGLVVVAGCLSPRSDPSSFFVLTPSPEPDRPSGAPANQFSLGIGPVSLPNYLDRPQMVTRLGDHELDIHESARWAEPLQASFTRSVAQNLGRMLPASQLVNYPWWTTQAPDFAVAIAVERFEPTATGAVELWCTWEVSGTDAGVLRREVARLSQPAGSDPAVQVAALSRALEQLSREIADAVRALAN